MTALLLSWLLRSTLLGSAGIALLGLTRHKSAAIRHAIAVGAVLAMLISPLLSLVLPTRTLQLPHAPEAVVYLTATRPVPVSQRLGVSPSIAPAESGLDDSSIPLIWMAVSLLLLSRIGLGICDLRRRHAGSVRVDVRGASCEVRQGDGEALPMMCWLGRTIIYLPAHWSHWTADRLDRVILHEEAHAKRRDWFTQVWLRVCCALLWPNPIVWVLNGVARQLAEEAADDLVLEAGSEPSSYASDLLEIARDAKATRPILAIPMARKAEVARRIEMILNTKRPRGKVTRLGIIVGSVLALGLCIPVSSSAFGSKGKQTTAAPTSQVTFEIRTRVYTASTLSVSHHSAIELGAKCTDCHRSVGSFDSAHANKTALVMTMSPGVVENIVAGTKKRGGVLLAEPRIVTASGQAASIRVEAAQEGELGLSLSITPTANRDGSASVDFELSEKSGKEVVAIGSGVIVVKAGQVVLLSDMAHRRLAIIEIKRSTP